MTRSTPAASPAFLALACVGFIASAPAHAGSDDKSPGGKNDEQDQGQIVVTGQLEQRDSPKATAKLVNTPRSVVVLPEQVIEQTGSASLADALRTVPGITFGAAEGGNPIGDRPFIRGFDSQGSSFVDGVRDIAAQTREVFAVEQVQIVRGSDSTLGGRGSAGGSINVVTKLPVAGNFVKAAGSFGTADYKRATLDVNQQLTDMIGVRVAAMWHDQDVAGRDAIWSRRWGVAPSFTLGLNSDTRMTLAYYYLESHELPDSGIPFLYTIANAPGTGELYSEPAIGDITTIGGVTGHVARETFYGLKSRDFRDATTHQVTLRVEHDFGAVTLRNSSRFSRNDQAYIFLLPDDSQGNVFGTAATNPTTGAAGARGDVLTGGYVWRRGNTRYGYTEALTNQTDLYGTFETGSVKHSFAVGTELSWEKARRGTFVTRGFLNTSGVEILSAGSTISPRCNTASIARFYCASLFDPNPSDPWVNYASDTSTATAPIVRSLPIAETQNDAKTLSVYAFDSITLIPSLVLNLGGRFDRFESKVTPGQAASATSTFSLSRTDNLFNWQAGLVFKPTANTSLYASYATSATPPNSLLGEGQEGNGLGTTNTAAALALLDSLKVEKTKSYEVGAKAALFDEQLSLTLAAFQTDTDNARVTGPDNTIEFVGKRRIRGVEFNFNGNVTKWLTVFGGYTHLDPKIVDGGFTALTAPAVVVGGVTVQPAKVVAVPSVNTGRQATQTARDSFTLWADLKPTSRLGVGGGAFYTSRVFGGYQDNRSATQNAAGVVTVVPATKVLSRTIPGYWRFDARLSYKVTDNIDLSVNVNNVTDETYFTQAYTSHYATIAPGRSAFATIGFKF
ncbi:MAG: TonB-dependent receptor [Sphingomonas sp.]|uniref:TonB-dependent receptor n=1 Tax=Sphingomonas sp. TaxID=28214 RepID=UPI00227429C7|nr:TonB-dependent receptor [Sphingomonas sp.]MCX8475169.1 TonB-dependent receptor [Sphingomonas sp.]